MMVILQKMILFTTLYVSTSFFSSIRFVIIHLVINLSTVLPVYCLATQEVDETFTVKIMIDFVCRFRAKAKKKHLLLVYLYIPYTLSYHTYNFLLSFQ